MSIGIRATDVQYAGIAGNYLFFTASNATFFGSGGVANTQFTDNNTAATDLFAHNMDNGTTQLLSHAAGDVKKGGNSSYSSPAPCLRSVTQNLGYIPPLAVSTTTKTARATPTQAFSLLYFKTSHQS